MLTQPMPQEPSPIGLRMPFVSRSGLTSLIEWCNDPLAPVPAGLDPALTRLARHIAAITAARHAMDVRLTQVEQNMERLKAVLARTQSERLSLADGLLARDQLQADSITRSHNNFMTLRVTLADQCSTAVGDHRVQADTIHASVTKLDAMADQVSEAASEITTASEQAAQATSQAEGAVNILLEAIAEATRITDEAARLASEASTAGTAADVQVRELNQTVESIAGITGMISAIAEQTNLLALNATIEAARAGDAGKGFAVVADEVKKLAVQTANATADVQALIERLGSGTHSCVKAVSHIGGHLKIIADRSNTLKLSLTDQHGTAVTVERAVAEAASAARGAAERLTIVTESVIETRAATARVREDTATMVNAITKLNNRIVNDIDAAINQAERRLSPRFVTDKPVSVFVHGASHEARLNDMSLGGVCIATGQNWPKGTQLSLTIPEWELSIDAQVLAQSPGRVHCCFSGELSAEARERLTLAVASLQRKLGQPHA